MKAAPFDSTPEFQHFREVMCGVLKVPKKRLDELVKKAKEDSAGITGRRKSSHLFKKLKDDA